MGCGLDTRFERVCSEQPDDGRVEWYDLDLPEVIELRCKLIGGEEARHHFLACSVFDSSWLDGPAALPRAQPFTQFLISTAWFLAMYRVLKRRGETVEQVGILTYQASAAYLHSDPRYLRRFVGFMTFSPRYLRRLARRALESHQRQHPGDYVFDYIPDDGQTFDYGVDYRECASVKLLTQQGAPELAPYLCPVDILYSQGLGWSLQRTTTLAEGGERCDFRFQRGRETRVVVPEPLRMYIESQTAR